MQYAHAQSIKKINIKIYSRFSQDIATFLEENRKEAEIRNVFFLLAAEMSLDIIMPCVTSLPNMNLSCLEILRALQGIIKAYYKS